MRPVDASYASQAAYTLACAPPSSVGAAGTPLVCVPKSPCAQKRTLALPAAPPGAGAVLKAYAELPVVPTTLALPAA